VEGTEASQTVVRHVLLRKEELWVWCLLGFYKKKNAGARQRKEYYISQDCRQRGEEGEGVLGGGSKELNALATSRKVKVQKEKLLIGPKGQKQEEFFCDGGC